MIVQKMRPRVWCFVVMTVLVFLLVIFAAEGQVCNEESTPSVTWPTTRVNSCSTSDPLCINPHNEAIERCCYLNHTWSTSPQCDKIQKKFGPCPTGAISKQDLCIFVIKNTKYPFRCPYEEILPFNYYVDLIDSNLFPIWMPVVRRKDRYGDGVFLYDEPSELYKQSLKKYTYKQPFKNKRCMVYHNSSYYEAEDCSIEHNGICAYFAIHRTTNRFCSRFLPNCYTSDYPSNSQCFCMDENIVNDKLKLAELPNPYQNHLATMFRRNCLMGLEKIGNEYVWVNSKRQLDYTFWADDVSFGDEYRYGVITEGGWKLASSKYETNCVIYQIPIHQEVTKLSLSYNSSIDVFFLNISSKTALVSSNGKPLVFCFTDADSEEFVRIIKLQVNMFTSIEDGPGHYWCEAIVYPDVKVVKSNEIFVRDSLEEYVAIVETSFTVPLTPENLANFRRRLHGEISQLTPASNFTTRLYKIVSFDENELKILLNLHFSRKSYEPLQHFSYLQEALHKIKNFTTKYLLSSSVCLLTKDHIGDTVTTWPVTKIGEVAERPMEGWCTKNDGSILNRNCTGDFINGAIWKELEEPCIVKQSTNATVNLTNIINQHYPSKYLKQVAEIVSSQQLKTERDVELLVEYLDQLIRSDNIDFNLTLEVINGIMNIPLYVLEAAQKEYGFMDKILLFTDRFIEISEFIGEVNLQNFRVFADFTANITTVDFYDDSFAKYYDSANIANTLKNFHCRVMLNKTLNCGTCGDERMSIILFKRPVLFRKKTGYNAEKVIKLFLPKHMTDNHIAVAFEGDDESIYSCSEWHYKPTHEKGHWVHKELPSKANNFLFCYFNGVSYNALVQINLTAILEEIMYENVTIQRKLQEMTFFVKHFSSELETEHLWIITMCLGNNIRNIKAKEEVEALSDLIDEIVDLSSTLHDISQKAKNTTTHILKFLRIVSHNIRTATEIQRRNFYWYVGDYTSSAMKGFKIKPCNESCNVDIIYNTTDELSADFELLVKFSIQQPISISNTSISFIIFFKHSLFGLCDRKNSSKVVSFMNTIGFPETTQVVYSLEPNATTNQSCQYWNNESRIVDFTQEEYISEEADKDYYTCVFEKNSCFWLVYDTVNVTSALDDIKNNQSDANDLLQRIIQILQTWLRILHAIDLFLISQIFANIGLSNETILKLCACILDILTYVHSDVLMRAQAMYNVTENMLYNIARISCLLNQPIAILETQIQIQVILLADSNATTYEYKFADYTIGVLIDESIINELKKTTNSRIVIIVYNTNNFFDHTMVTTPVFGVFIPNYPNTFLKRPIQLTVGPPVNTSNFKCISWRPSTWEYSGEALSSSCKFFEQGHLALTSGANVDVNIRRSLENVFNASVYQKLYTLQSVSHYYIKFLPYDLKTVALLYQSINQKLDDLDEIIVTINNLLRIPKETLKTSDIQYKALRGIMMNLNRIVRVSNIQKYLDSFGAAKCNLCTTKFVALTNQYKLKCMNDTSLADNIVTLQINPDSLLRENKCEVAVTVYKSPTFFTDSSGHDTSIILGASVYKRIKSGNNVTITFNRNLFKQDHCASWVITEGQDVTGFWSSTAAAQTLQYKSCSFTSLSYYTLITTTLTEIISNIQSYYTTTTDKLYNLKDALNHHSTEIRSRDIKMVADLFKSIDHIAEEPEMILFTEIVGMIVGVDKYTLNPSNCTDCNHGVRILHQVNRLLASYGGTAKIETTSVCFLITETIEDMTVRCNGSCLVSPASSAAEAESSVRRGESDAALVLNEYSQYRAGNMKTIVQVYCKDTLFYEGRDEANGVVVKVDGKRSESYTIYYKNERPVSEEYCGYWSKTSSKEDESGKWTIDALPMNGTSVSMCSARSSNFYALIKLCRNTTTDLIDIETSNSNFTEKLRNVADFTDDKAQMLHPIDLLIISRILERFSDAKNITNTDMIETSRIINNLLKVPRYVLQESQLQYSATDRILYYLDQIALSVESFTDLFELHQFSSISINFNVMNVSGFAIEQDLTEGYRIQFLETGTTIDQIATMNTLRSGILLSNEILKQLNNLESNRRNQKMIANIFFKDSLFNEVEKRNVTIVNGVLLPGLNHSLNGDIHIFYKEDGTSNKTCNFWDYEIKEKNGKGKWKTDVKPQNMSSIVVCSFNHLTHFAMLIGNDDTNYNDPETDYILDLINNVGCSLSLLGVMGIVFTAVMFERWRKNTGNQILLNFSFAISIKMIMLYVSHAASTLKENQLWWCCISGAILHYAILSESSWMLIIAILQFKRFVEVLGGPPKYILLKACICGWMFPMFPVLVILATNPNNYLKGHLDLCYPHDLGMYLGVWLPLIIIITINSVIFIFIMYNVCHKKTEAREPVKHETLFQWRLALLLFSILGITWIFGFLSLIDETRIFLYLFCCTATLQGFVIFLFFIVFNKSTRMLYKQALKMWLYSKGYKLW